MRAGDRPGWAGRIGDGRCGGYGSRRPRFGWDRSAVASAAEVERCLVFRGRPRWLIPTVASGEGGYHIGPPIRELTRPPTRICLGVAGDGGGGRACVLLVQDRFRRVPAGRGGQVV